MSVIHDSFTLSREIAACPAHVFSAWADPAKKRAWFVDGDGPQWTERDYSLEFRVGGRETGRFVLSGDGPAAGTHENATTYLEIAEGTRIVFAYTMAINGRIHSASLATVEFHDRDGGTRLVYTEQIAAIGQSDGAPGRQHGWQALLDNLADFMSLETAQ